MRFDPFSNRLCRDIRNHLSSGLIFALKAKDFQTVLTVANQYSGKDIETCQRDYIENRIERYERVFKQVYEHSFDDVYTFTLYLWNEELFYEVHEYLEYWWKRAFGIQKELLQALIRAAGTYIHLEQGNMVGAEKMATKAIHTLEEHRKLLPVYLDAGLLILKLRILDPVPPKLFLDSERC